MSPLEPLAPDQRAVVALVLQQGRSYDEIAALLGMPVDAVRARAHAGLVALVADNGLPDEVTGPLADYLLGQQRRRDAESTRGLLAESEPARRWASDVAARLRDVARDDLPEIPSGKARPEPPADAEPDRPDIAKADSPPGPRPRPVRKPASEEPDESAPAASRLGGVLLIAAVLAVVAVVLFLVLRDGDDTGDEKAASSTPAVTATPTPTPTAAPAQVADRIPLKAAAGGKAKGTMTVYLQGDRLLFELVAQNVPPSGTSSAYAIWLTGPGAKARRLGFATVGEDGKLGIQGPSDKDVASFPKLYATFANVVVSRETSQATKRPGKVVLSGKLPKGR
jgi:Sigma-70, region 4